MSSHYKYLDMPSDDSENSTLTTGKIQAKRALRVPPLQLDSPGRVPFLQTQHLKKREERPDDQFYLEEYRNSEIPLSRKGFNWKYPYWFQSQLYDCQSKIPSFESTDQLFNQYKQDLSIKDWLESIKRDVSEST